MSDGGNVPDDPVSKRAAFWFTMIRFVGWPGAILIALGYGAYEITLWSAPKVDAVIQAHVTVVTGLLEQAQIQNKNQTQSNLILEEIKENQKIYAKALDHHGELIGEIHSAVVPPKNKSSNN